MGELHGMYGHFHIIKKSSHHFHSQNRLTSIVSDSHVIVKTPCVIPNSNPSPPPPRPAAGLQPAGGRAAAFSGFPGPAPPAPCAPTRRPPAPAEGSPQGGEGQVTCRKTPTCPHGPGTPVPTQGAAPEGSPLGGRKDDNGNFNSTRWEGLREKLRLMGRVHILCPRENRGNNGNFIAISCAGWVHAFCHV